MRFVNVAGESRQWNRWNRQDDRRGIRNPEIRRCVVQPVKFINMTGEKRNPEIRRCVASGIVNRIGDASGIQRFVDVTGEIVNVTGDASGIQRFVNMTVRH